MTGRLDIHDTQFRRHLVDMAAIIHVYETGGWDDHMVIELSTGTKFEVTRHEYDRAVAESEKEIARAKTTASDPDRARNDPDTD